MCEQNDIDNFPFGHKTNSFSYLTQKYANKHYVKLTYAILLILLLR